MKKLIIFILLLLFSCGVTKEKSKQKNSTEAEISSKSELQNNNNGSVNLNSTKNTLTESSVQNDFEKNKLLSNQNFVLKSNGKCAEPGAIRNVQFTDKAGNTTTIPVNDNTELSFGNQSEESKELASLKEDKRVLTNEKNDLQHRYDNSTKLLAEAQEKVKKQFSDINSKTKKNTFWQFVLCAVLAVVVWEGGKKLIKTYIL